MELQSRGRRSKEDSLKWYKRVVLTAFGAGAGFFTGGLSIGIGIGAGLVPCIYRCCPELCEEAWDLDRAVGTEPSRDDVDDFAPHPHFHPSLCHEFAVRHSYASYIRESKPSQAMGATTNFVGDMWDVSGGALIRAVTTGETWKTIVGDVTGTFAAGIQSYFGLGTAAVAGACCSEPLHPS